jgi:hypothetical protein
MGKLSPGCIEFIDQNVSFGLNVDVAIEIEAYDYPDRAENIEERAETIRAVLHSFMPDYTFMIWLKLVKAGFASDVKDEESDCSMHMEDAIARAKRIIATSM